MKTIFAIAVISAAVNSVFSHVVSPQIETDEFIQSINKKATTWTARKNFVGWTPEQLRSLGGVIGISHDDTPLPTVYHNVQAIPESFDSRENWPSCASLTTIRNQGACGSCWAFAASEVMSDRLCISTDGEKNFVFSPEELLSCCTTCGDCGGGYLISPYKYWLSNGVPSGGDYKSGLGCRPYTASAFENGVTPECTQICVSGYNKSWSDDLRHGINAYQIAGTDLEQIQTEIMTNGPVTAYIDLYEDFYSYGEGIYQHVGGNFVSGHAVKLIGWGSQDDTLYWLGANSWGTDFGEGGFFKIIRGVNEVRMENYVFAGTPNIDE